MCRSSVRPGHFMKKKNVVAIKEKFYRKNIGPHISRIYLQNIFFLFSKFQF